MNRFWSRFVKPVIETASPRRMMEIGADSGWNTERLLEYCRQTGCVLEIVDPAPRLSLHEVMAKFGSGFVYHALKSHDAIPRIEPVDLVLLDGDHNWFTVYNELQFLFRRAQDGGVAPPIVLFHDVAWPYARRDMYYDPNSIPPGDRHPFAYRGMVPGRSELVEGGMNGTLANALQEGGPRNGVLTAIEDFRAACGVETAFHTLPFFNGLGILVPAERSTPALAGVIDGFYSAASLLETCTALEADSMAMRAQLAAYQIRLTQRTDALHRAKAVIDGLSREPVASAPSPAPAPAPAPERHRIPIGVLLRLEGTDFVNKAYLAVLGRAADDSGLAHYAERLEGKGRAEKIEILCSLTESAEGRECGAHLPGLQARALYYRLRRISPAQMPRRALRWIARGPARSEA